MIHDYIETDIYEPIPEKPGLLRYVGQRTLKEVFQELEQRLKADGLLQEVEYFGICVTVRYSDEWRDGNGEGYLFPAFRWIACYAVTGSSEGHYVHIDAIMPDGERMSLGGGKTFMGWEAACKLANACAYHLGA